MNCPQCNGAWVLKLGRHVCGTCEYVDPRAGVITTPGGEQYKFDRLNQPDRAALAAQAVATIEEVETEEER